MSNLFAFGDKVIGGGESSQSGGHKIQNGEGIELPQRDTLQFSDGLDAEDDVQGNKTVVKDKVTDIEWTDWIAMTDEEQEAYKQSHYKINILNAPGADGSIDVELLTKLWENPNYTVNFSSQNITLNSDDYDFLLWIFNISINSRNNLSVIVKKGFHTFLGICSGNNIFGRTVNRVDDVTFTVGDGYNVNTVNNVVCIPIAIYGIKSKRTVHINAIAKDVSTSASKCMMPNGEATVAQAIFWVDESKFVSHDTSVGYNSSYTAPEDGMYIWYLAGNGSSGASLYSDSNRTKIIAGSNKGTDFSCVHIPLKRGQIIYTRNLSGLTHRVLGHYKL